MRGRERKNLSLATTSFFHPFPSLFLSDFSVCVVSATVCDDSAQPIAGQVRQPCAHQQEHG
jgi:hypothetical protein